jgi:hypothetical protein
MGKNNNQIFNDDFMLELRKILRLQASKDEKRLLKLRAELRILGRNYRQVISSTPSDLPSAPFNETLTRRADWLEAQVLNPLDRLLNALSEDNRPMFSTWPGDTPPPVKIDFKKTSDDLEQLLSFAKYLKQELRNQQSDDANHSQEIRAMIVYDIILVLREIVPELSPSRGTYDKKSKRYLGSFPEAVVSIYHEITEAYDERLDRLIASFAKSKKSKPT